jgi:tetratricopeptide (TPR) repeat protein
MAPSMARPLMLALALATLSACTTGTRSDLAIREKGDYEFNRGNYEVARVEYLEYSKLRPGRPDVLHNLGVCALKTGRTDEALHFLRLAYDLEPQNVEYTDNLAEAMYTAGKYDELYELLRDRTKQPGTVNDYLRLGEFAERMGDPDEAENALPSASRWPSSSLPIMTRSTSASAFSDISRAPPSQGLLRRWTPISRIPDSP